MLDKLYKSSYTLGTKLGETIKGENVVLLFINTILDAISLIVFLLVFVIVFFKSSSWVLRILFIIPTLQISGYLIGNLLIEVAELKTR